MTVRVWRLADARYAKTIWSGEGARLNGGRWNSLGVAVIYASATRSLAALEQLVHLGKPRVLTGYVFSSLDLLDSQIDRLDVNSLPSGWDDPVAATSTKQIGDAWLAAAKSLALAVPSIVMPGEWNYLINPGHPDFPSTRRTAAEPFSHDPRLG